MTRTEFLVIYGRKPAIRGVENRPVALRPLSESERAAYDTLTAAGSMLVARSWLFLKSIADAAGRPLLKDEDLGRVVALHPPMVDRVVAEATVLNQLP